MTTRYTEAVLHDRYLHGTEQTAHAVFERVAKALAENEGEYQAFHKALHAGLIPGGRIMAGAGTGPQAVLLNCFVHPLTGVRGTPPAHDPKLRHCLAQARRTLQCGGGVGYDFSPIPARHADSLPGAAGLGPVGLLETFEALAADPALQPRGGAQMGVLRCDHPDIEAFIATKQTPGVLRHFNLSVGLTDAFMHAVADDRSFTLRAPPSEATAGACPGRPVRQIAARRLWQQLCAAAWAHGEPGVLFLDTIAAHNNLSYCETLHATNPCGEVPLPAYGACALASIDLTRFVRAGLSARARLDWPALQTAVHTAVHLLERVLERTAWPLAEYAAQALATRRIGLGFLGLADCLILLGLHYATPAARGVAAHITRFMRYHAYLASHHLARQRGPFALFDAQAYLSAPHAAAGLPRPLRAAIGRFGIRHSHLMAIAPTGAIAIAFADNASRGIEPVAHWFAPCAVQRAYGGAEHLASIDPVYAQWRTQFATHGLPKPFVCGEQVSESAQLAMVAAVAPLIDGAIAKTIRLGPHTSPHTVSTLLQQAWRAKIKGITVYRPNSALVRLHPDRGHCRAG